MRSGECNANVDFVSFWSSNRCFCTSGTACDLGDTGTLSSNAAYDTYTFDRGGGDAGPAPAPCPPPATDPHHHDPPRLHAAAL